MVESEVKLAAATVAELRLVRGFQPVEPAY